MTENTPTTPEAPGKADETASSSGTDDGSSRPSAEQPQGASLFGRVAALFKPRAGGSLRDNLTDALAEQDTDAGRQSFSPAERAMLHNILRLREVRVEDVMVPRADIEGIDVTTSLGDLMVLFESSGHSRMPVYSETLDDPRGMVHIRDVVGHITRAARQKPVRSRKAAAQQPAPPRSGQLDMGQVDLTRPVGELGLVRPVLFVPPSMLASDLMARMQTQRIQIALVIDEYGGTDGLVSLEDIVEMVVGDIEDEHDDDEALITQAGDGVFIVDAKAEIEEVAKMIGSAFTAGEHGEYVDTIGGLLFNALGRVPARGEVIQAIPGFEFHILDADPRRIKRVRIVQTRVAERRRRQVRETQQ